MLRIKKTQLALRIIQGVDQKIIGLFSVFNEIILERYPTISREKRGLISGALVNDLYDCHTTSKEFQYLENRGVIIVVLENFIRVYGKRNLLITNSVQYYITANFTLGSKKMRMLTILFQ